MQRQLVSEANTDKITALLQEAACPICQGYGCWVQQGEPLTDQFGRFGWDKIVCAANKYHVLSVEGFSSPDYLIVSIMDRTDHYVPKVREEKKQ